MKVLLTALLVGGVVGCATDGLDENAFEIEEGDVPSMDQLGEEETSTVSQASVSEGFVAGAGPVNDDFGDEGPVDSNSHRQSLAAGLWQTILWADGAIELDGTAFDTSDIDCDFGPNTTAATRSWQARHRISDVDGSAGPKTFSVADDKLVPFFPTGDVGPTTVVYKGAVNRFTMIRKEGVGSANHAYQALAVDDRLRVIFYSFISSCSSSFWLGS
jgi:hypothetical protein